MRNKIIFLFLLLLTSLCMPIYPDSQESDLSLASQLQTPFIRNEGQLAADDVKFYARLFNGTVFVTDKGELVYNLTYPKDYLGADDIMLPSGHLSGILSERIKERLVTDHDTSDINIQGLIRAETSVNYITGHPATSRNHIATYKEISLGQAWHDINIRLKATAKNIEKIFIVGQNGNPKNIKIELNGIEHMALKESGNLELKTPIGGVEFTKPIAYQEINGEKKPVEAAYLMLNEKTYGFSVGDYDLRFPLIIDPLLASTYIGGTGADICSGIARDASGNVFITGAAQTGYPTTAGVFQSAFTFVYDIVVSKFNSDISALLASTYIGSQSNRSEYGYAIAVDGSGNVFVTGTTGSITTYPSSPATAGAYDTSFGGSWDVFVAKLNNNLTSSGFAFTFLGGSGDDRGYGITIDRNDNIFVCGVAGNSTFPATGGPYTTFGGSAQDGFVARFNNNLSATGFTSTFLGGSANDFCTDIAIDNDDNIVTVGLTYSIDFPTSPSVPSLGSADVFITKFNNSLTATLYSTRIGGSGYDVGCSIAVGRSNNIYIAGTTASLDFPVIFTGSSVLAGGLDAFITKLSPSLNIINSRYLGGSGTDVAWDLTLAPFAEQIFVAGYTTSTNFPTYPTSPAPSDTTLGGASDFFITRLDNTLNIAASTYLGGSGTESSTSFENRLGIAADNLSNLFIAGSTSSTNFPLNNPITTPYNGSIFGGGTSDIVVCKITPDLSGGTPLTSVALTAPTITFPINLTSNVLIPPVLQWSPPSNPIDSVVYYVYMSTNAYPLTLIYSGLDTSTIPSVAYETVYFWYVVASDSSGRIRWSPVSQFTTEVNPLFISGSSGEAAFDSNSFTKPLGSCFIATAVYGSPEHPNVISLKLFRDKHLANTQIGRHLVKWYYQVSPPIASYLRHSPIQASITRLALAPIVYTIKYPYLMLLLLSVGAGLFIFRIQKSSQDNNQ